MSQSEITTKYDLPVIFIPGFMASTLERERRGLLSLSSTVWPLNVVTLTTQLWGLRNQNSLKATDLIAGYYDSLLDFVTGPQAGGGLGRKTNESFWVFTYDWRQSCHDSGQALAIFIKEKLDEANQRRDKEGLPLWDKVDIINHSLGGFVTRSTIQEFAAPVRRVVYIASGHYGFAKSYFVLHPASVGKMLDDFVIDFIPSWYWNLLKLLPNIWYLQGWLAKLLRTFPSVYEMLPDQFYLEEEPGLILDASTTPPRKIYGVEATYFENPWEFPLEMQSRAKQAFEFKTRLGRDLPGKDNLVIYAETLPTYAQVTYNGQLEKPEQLAIGDGTVIGASVSRAQPATQLKIEASHTRLPNHPQVHAAIRGFLL